MLHEETFLHAVIIRRKDGSEFLASGTGPGALFFRQEKARALAKELRPQFKCRVARVKVTVQEIISAKPLAAGKKMVGKKMAQSS